MMMYLFGCRRGEKGKARQDKTPSMEDEDESAKSTQLKYCMHDC